MGQIERILRVDITYACIADDTDIVVDSLLDEPLNN
jgi:hypothetical protein